MRIYLASRYSRCAEMRFVRDSLIALGHEVTSQWIDNHGGMLPVSLTRDQLAEDPRSCSVYAIRDVEDLTIADCVISFTGEGGKGGRHVEFGLGAGLGKRLILVGPRENVFHCLPQVEVYQTMQELLSVL